MGGKKGVFYQKENDLGVWFWYLTIMINYYWVSDVFRAFYKTHRDELIKLQHDQYINHKF